MSDYINEEDVTYIRVFDDEGDHWAIDGIDDSQGYTEIVWTGWFDGTLFKEFKTLSEALAHVDAFRETLFLDGHPNPEHLPVTIGGEFGQVQVI